MSGLFEILRIVEWRRSVLDSVRIDASVWSHASFLHGGNLRTIQQTRTDQLVEDMSYIQRYQRIFDTFRILIRLSINKANSSSIYIIHYSFTGVGYCAVFIAFYVSFYYNVIIGWSLYYAANSLTFTLPWTNCNNTWNTEYCTLRCDNTSRFNCNETRSPAKEYFK